MKIVIAPNGPYLVHGEVPLALQTIVPDTHSKITFDGTETASRGPFDREAKTIDGPTVTLKDDEPL